jgi:hypothetical protein
MQRSSVGPSRRRWIATLDIKILPFTPRVKQRQRPAQRYAPFELEVIFCVYGVISALLSNIYLTEVDRMLERAKTVTTRLGYTAVEYARFADDLVVLVDAHPRHAWLKKSVPARLRQELAAGRDQ